MILFYRLVFTYPFVLNETLVDPALAGQDLFAELFSVVLASEVQGPVQVEVIGLINHQSKKYNINSITSLLTLNATHT